ncbi:hypothetical protein ACXPWS_15460 [Mycobacterium sp. BMJ-28]
MDDEYVVRLLEAPIGGCSYRFGDEAEVQALKTQTSLGDDGTVGALALPVPDLHLTALLCAFRKPPIFRRYPDIAPRYRPHGKSTEEKR